MFLPIVLIEVYTGEKIVIGCHKLGWKNSIILLVTLPDLGC
jgi:hypothetical protein